MQVSIPCTRHDEDGDQNTRLRETLAYANGLSGQDIGAHLSSLHDRKGCLTAEWKTSAAGDILGPMLDRAWKEYGYECWSLHILVGQDADEFEEKYFEEIKEHN